MTTASVGYSVYDAFANEVKRPKEEKEDTAFLTESVTWSKSLEKKNPFVFDLSAIGDTAAVYQPSSGHFSDNSAALTRRLVSAVSQFETRQVMLEATRNLMTLRAASVGRKGKDLAKIMAAIKALEKLVNRADRKIKDLAEEETLKSKQTKAEMKRQRERAEEIRNELRKRVAGRGAREGGYLTELLHNAIFQDPNARLDAATEARIAMEANARAAAEISFGAGGGDIAIGGAAGEVTGGGEGSAGDAAPVEAAEAAE